MENKVKDAYLAYYIDNSHSYGNVISVSGAVFESETFALDLWFYIEGSAGVLLSQEDGFSIGIDNGGIVFRHPSHKTMSVQNSLLKITQRAWTNLYMGYDGKEVVFLVNGVHFGAFSCEGGVRNAGDFMLGKEFTGYVRTLRLYERTIAEEDFRNYCFAASYSAAEMPGTAAFLDLTDKDIPDLSGKDVKTEVHGACAPVDLVDVYRPSDGKYASFPDAPGINPGGFSTGAFSIYVKVYLCQTGRERHILAANGAIGEKESVSVFAQKKEAGTVFGICIGGKEFVFDAAFSVYSWVDVIFSVSGKRIDAFLNGAAYSQTMDKEFQRTKTGDFTVGGCPDEPAMSCGYALHTVAVFDKSLNAKDAGDFLENHPFVLEEGEVALVDFGAGSADELCADAKVCVDQSDLNVLQRSVGTLPDSPYTYRVNGTLPAASDMKKWEAELVMAVFACFAEETYCLAASAGKDALTALACRISRNKALLGEASDLYFEPDVAASKAAESLSSLDRGIFKMLFKGLSLRKGIGFASASMAAVGAAAANSVSKKYAGLFALGTVVVLSGAAAAAVMANKKHSDKPDHDDDEKDATVRLSSITFQSAPDDYQTSAVRCRNHDGAVCGAEWTKEGRCVYPAVYIADRIKKAKIRIRFRISDQSAAPAGTYSVMLSASVVKGEKKLFDNFRYEQQGLVADKEYDVLLESSVVAGIEKDFSYSEIGLWWNCRINGEAVAMPNTVSEIYIIPTEPSAPVQMDGTSPDDLIAVEYLGILARVKQAAQTENAAVSCRAAAGNAAENITLYERIINVTQWMYHSPLFIYQNGGHRYNTLDHVTVEKMVCNVLVFHEKRFLKDMWDMLKQEAPKRIPIQCDEYACIVASYFRIWGVQCSLVILKNPCIEGGKSGLLHMKGVCPAGQVTAGDIDFDYHMIVEVPPQKILPEVKANQVFDASMGIPDGSGTQGTSALAGYPFCGISSVKVNKAKEAGTYRGIAFADGSGAIITGEKCMFVRDTVSA